MTRPTKPTFKKSLQDQRRASLQAQQAMAHDGMSDAAKRHLAEFAATVKPRVSRVRRQRTEADEPLEHDEQKTVVSWWYHYSKTRGLDHRLLVAVPNSQALLRFATNPAAFMMYLKTEGMRVGMLDLVLFVPRRWSEFDARTKWHGLLIEMKRKTKGVISQEQAGMINVIGEQGYCTMVCKGADEAISAIRKYIEG